LCSDYTPKINRCQEFFLRASRETQKIKTFKR
jgi:hypothetical protein